MRMVAHAERREVEPHPSWAANPPTIAPYAMCTTSVQTAVRRP
jgi:hypothetical protein